mmetsp:Transcript_83667/g.218492  ORF Transcript_83667/g.218492 Transcript_83667/m.218492 type:complete len:249 (-) Transcript_83667:606-1352(-)
MPQRSSRFSGERTSSFTREGRPTSAMSCCVSTGSDSRMWSPSRLKNFTRPSKTGLDSGKVATAGKNVAHSFQNSGGDFVSVSTSSCARLASVSKTRTETSSGTASLWHCSTKDATRSFLGSRASPSSWHSCAMLAIKGRMMSATGFTNSECCCMVARAPEEFFEGSMASTRLWRPVGLATSAGSFLLGAWLGAPLIALTVTSATCSDSMESSLLGYARSSSITPSFTLRSFKMSMGASCAFCSRLSKW